MSENDRFVGMTVGELIDETLKPQERRAQALILQEYLRATEINGSFASAHEGYAVILEELDELKEEVWKKERARDPDNMIKEAVQVAAMGMRFLVDVAFPLEKQRAKV